MQTGLLSLDGRLYCFGADGLLVGEGWQTVDEKLYWCRNDGTVRTGGYAQREGVWYRLTAEGAVPDETLQGDYLVVYDVTEDEFGADGTDEESDSAAINAAIRRAAQLDNPDEKEILILVPDGTYCLGSAVIVFSNITLRLDDDAVMLRQDLSSSMLVGAHLSSSGDLCSDSTCTHGGYSQIRHVTVTGGTWDGNVHSDRADIYSNIMLGLAHGEDITISDTVLQNDCSLHMLILDAVKNVTIDGVTFKNEYLYTGPDTYYYDSAADRSTFTALDWLEVALYKEALHIDVANAEGSSSLPLDNTPCQNITVTNCVFDNVLCGVGSHHVIEGLEITGVSVSGNTFSHLRGAAIDAYGIAGLDFRDNTVTDAEYLLNSIHAELTLSGNTASRLGLAYWCDSCTLTAENESYALTDTITGKAAVRAMGASSLTLRSCELSGALYGGVLAVESSTVTLDGLTLTDIAGEAVILFHQATGSVTNCSLTGTADYGVSVGQTADVLISGNTIQGFAQYAITGYDAQRLTITGNTAVDSGSGWDISIVNGTDCVCTGNTVTCRADNIYFSGENNTVSDNTMRDPVTGWIEENEAKYYYLNGVMQTGWQKIGNVWYYFWGSGKMAAAGWLNLSGTFYYLSDSGAMHTGWLRDDGNWYYFGADGRMVTGWQKIGNTWYYFWGGGNMHTGWLEQNGAYYYLADSGAMAVGWKQINGIWYWFAGSGAMVTDWQKIDNTWYYFRSSGKMVTGWLYLDGSVYYFSGSGAMVTGWLRDSGDWYYFGAGGRMVTGWQKIGNAWYYFWGGGKMATAGWLNLNGSFYYLSDSGAMVTGWLRDGGDWYYFGADGRMVTGWQKIGSSWYYFWGGGNMHTGWLNQNGTYYYFDDGGAMVTGSRVIGGMTYTFDSSGRWVS